MNTPLPRDHFRHDLRNAAISIGIVLAVFLVMPVIGGAVAEWMVNG